MNILLLASHAVAEYDDLRMFTDLGFDCFAPGGYEVPGSEGEGIRPPLPDAPHHPDLVARLLQSLRHRQAHVAEPDESDDRHGTSDQLMLKMTVFLCVKCSSIASSDASRPRPDCLMPP